MVRTRQPSVGAIDNLLGEAWLKECGLLMSERRLAKRMRSSVLGGFAGCNEVTIWRIENGLINPRDTLKLGIAAALDCEVEDLWPMPRRAEVIAALEEEVVA